MISFSILETIRGQDSVFAEYEVLVSGNGVEWRMTSNSPIKDNRLYFADKWKIKAGERQFKIRVDDPNNELANIRNLELLVPNKESGLYGESQRMKSSPAGFEFYFKTRNGKQNQVCLVRDLMADSRIVLQWSLSNGDKVTRRFPIFVQPDAAAKARYLFMKNELESEGLYSFIYDELRGIFSLQRISLEWKEGGSALSQEDSWVERDAIHTIWNWFFSKAIPVILQAPAYDIKRAVSIERISRIRHPIPSMFRKGMLFGNEFVVARVRRQNYAIPAHVVIVSFLKRVILRQHTICDQLYDEIAEANKRQIAEANNVHGKRVIGALRSIEGEIEDLQRILSDERTQLKRMKEDLRRLESTPVFQGAFADPAQSVFDVDPACFSFNDIYRATRKRIIDFDSQYYNWHARANASSLRARPLDSTQKPEESVYQWKYSKVYQFWCYYHFVRAALSIGLRPLTKDQFNSYDGSWIAFETKDSSTAVRLSLFHEVKGYAQRKLWAAAKTPLQTDKWCVGGKHDDDLTLSGENEVKYREPDFIMKIEGVGKTPFLVVLDAKADPVWSYIHSDAQRKYRSFCQYLKGYRHTSIEDPAYLVKTFQSWIIFPDRYHSRTSVSVGGAWSLNANQLAFTDPWKLVYSPSTGKVFPDIDTSKVCLGRLTADPSIGVKNQTGINHPPIDYRKPFEDFLRMQIGYFRMGHPDPKTSFS